jgi:hypothetical protein
MKTEHLEKAYQTSDALLDELGEAQKENPSDAELIFLLVQAALKLNTEIGVILAAANQANAKKTKGKNEQVHT